MAYDQDERMNAEQKEEGNGVVAAENVNTDAVDTEFAADTWMGAVLNPEAIRPRGNISYEPFNQTEKYRGEGSPENSETDLPLYQETRNAVGDRMERRSVRSIVGDDTETAAEIATPIRNQPRSPVTESSREDAAGGLGMVGLGLSILSLFLLPYLVAPIGMVIGYLAYRRNARTLGTWAMMVGALAILGALVIYPYFVAR